MSNNKLKLTTIKAQTKDGKEIEFTLDEARDFYHQLHELFGTKFVPQVPIVVERDWPYPHRWVGPTAQPATPFIQPVVWCESACTSSGLALSFGGTEIR